MDSVFFPGEPLIAATQDFITGGFLITQKDLFFNRAQFCQVCAMLLAGNDINMRIDIPKPAIVKVSSNQNIQFKQHTFFKVKTVSCNVEFPLKKESEKSYKEYIVRQMYKESFKLYQPFRIQYSRMKSERTKTLEWRSAFKSYELSYRFSC